MAGNENVSINIDSRADLRGFKQAETAASKLNKTVKGLAATLGVAYGTRAVVNFGKASVKAFTDDQKSAVKLSQAVKNLGLSFEQTNIESFIASLESSAGIADDVLRPAFQALLTTTGDVAKSQDLLKTAINVSRGSGEELNTVVDDLSKSYVGITKGLEKYKLGLSRAQLKEMSFLDVQERLNKQFDKGSAAYLATYAGKMDLLTTAAGRAQETIGGALINAIINLSGAGDVQGVVTKIDGIAAASERAITRVGELGQALYFSLFKLDYAEFLGFSNAGIDRFEKIIEEQRRRAQYSGASPFDAGNNSVTGYQKDKKAAADAKKAADLQAKLLKQSLDNQKKLTAEQKKQAALKKAGTVFDLEQIQLVAALKGKLSKEEELRVQAQLALLNGNDVLATKLTNQIIKAQDESGNLAKFLAALPNAKNPFEYLDNYLTYIASRAKTVFTDTAYADKLSYLGGNTSVISPVSPSVIPPTNVPSNPSDGMVTYNPTTGLNYNPNITVNVGGSVVTSQGLIDEIRGGLNVASLSGSSANVDRRIGGW